MDDWKKFNEAKLPEKKDFYSHLNMVDITDADYSHAIQNCKNFEINILGEYYDLHLQWYIDTLLLADVFENLQNMCLKIYDLNPARFILHPF